MAEYKDAFQDRIALKVTHSHDAQMAKGLIGIAVVVEGVEHMFIADNHTFKDIVRELNTLTWVVGG